MSDCHKKFTIVLCHLFFFCATGWVRKQPHISGKLMLPPQPISAKQRLKALVSAHPEIGLAYDALMVAQPKGVEAAKLALKQALTTAIPQMNIHEVNGIAQAAWRDITSKRPSESGR